MAQNFVESNTAISIADSASVSGAFQINKDTMFAGIFVSDMADSADITITVCDTLGGTYVPIADPLDGAAMIFLASGTDVGYFDLSNYIMGIPSTYFFKLKCSVAQTTGSAGLSATLLEKA